MLQGKRGIVFGVANEYSIAWAIAKVAHEHGAQLPSYQRAALLLRYGEGLSVAEIADALGVPTGTVKAWLFRGREALRRHFKKVGLL